MIIGKRSLELRLDEGMKTVPICLYAPVDRSPGWACRYTIGWPDGRRDSEGWGHEAVQAVWLTLQKIGVDIYTSTYHRSGRLVWQEPGGGYGFPVPKNGRDMLIGDDLRFDG